MGNDGIGWRVRDYRWEYYWTLYGENGGQKADSRDT
jgi:hypothetical protein